MPLQRKMLLPYLALVLIVGTSGAVLVVHQLTDRAQVNLDQQLSQSLLNVQAGTRNEELYALEAANFAANVTGISGAVHHRELHRLGSVIESVRALKGDLDLLAFTDLRGNTLASYQRPTGTPHTRVPSQWRKVAALAARKEASGDPRSMLISLGSDHYLGVVEPVCSGVRACDPVGVAIAGLNMSRVIAANSTSGQITAYSNSDVVLASQSSSPPPDVTMRLGSRLLRRRQRIGDVDSETLYGSFILQNRAIGVVATTIPVSGAFASVRDTAYRFALIILLAMLVVVMIAALLSRAILGQVRVLLRSHRQLGAGNLDVRAEITGGDEVGQLAVGFNQMAEQLQAAVTTLESRADQTAEEVRRLLALRTQFFAGMSHEFRTPLAIIRTQTELLLERTPSRDESSRRTLLAVNDAAGQALELVNEVLEVSRAESDRVEVNLADVSVARVVEQLTPVIEGLAAGAGLKAIVSVPSDLPVVHTDAKRLRQILLNLVDNAVKYTPEGGQISVSARFEAERVLLLVQDTGVGIPADALPSLFEPFYTVPNTSTQRGQASSGLGLALTHQWVEALGGEIFVVSEPGAGTTMTVSLPVPEQAVASAPAQRSVRRVAANRRRGSAHAQ